MPGDALRGMVDPATTTAADLEAMREAHGLLDPWYVQYASWMRRIFLEGDFGRSIRHGIPVTSVIADRLVNTMRLSLVTAFFTYLIALPLGLWAAKKKGTLIDRGIMVYTFVALSMPTIILSLINVMFFGFMAGWFPVAGSITLQASAEGGFAAFASRMHHLILPGITLALLGTTGIIYFLRSEIIDFENSDFVTTARSKGVPESKIYTRHILRNALLPIAGHAGIIVVGIFTGSVFVETIFSFPGMGELFLTSIVARDFPVANILIMFYSILGVIAVLVTDIAITIIDPRIHIK